MSDLVVDLLVRADQVGGRGELGLCERGCGLHVGGGAGGAGPEARARRPDEEGEEENQEDVGLGVACTPVALVGLRLVRADQMRREGGMLALWEHTGNGDVPGWVGGVV